MENVEGIYKREITQQKSKLKKVQKDIYRVSILRLSIAVCVIFLIIYWGSIPFSLNFPLLAILIVSFLLFINKHNTLFYKKSYLEALIKSYEEEIEALHFNFEAFESGEEHINPNHFYTYDLDVFGEDSLFKMINRGESSFGKDCLAEWFEKHLVDGKKIERRQEAINELKPLLKIRQKIRALGKINTTDTLSQKNLQDFTDAPLYFNKLKIYKILPFLVLTLNIALAILASVTSLSWNFLIGNMVFWIIFNSRLTNRITELQTSYGKFFKSLTNYSKQFEIIENENWKSSLLKEVQNNFKCKANSSASKEINALAKKLNSLDQRNNIIVSSILNGLCLWEIRKVQDIELWKVKNNKGITNWFNTLGKFEALCSLATFAFNHTNYITPKISDKPFQLSGDELKHPLMKESQCVANDINIMQKGEFIIITGANMAGKSTYLRCIGTNLLLASIGSVIPAKEFEFKPTQIITSLRTNDSLSKNESYFFAELKRLGLIIDKLNRKEELFIILDEILKGTNSLDKQKGSFSLVKQLISLQSNGIIATHDLLLGELKNSFPKNISNYCFEAEIKNEELTFSYKKKKGVAQNMNACFLMQKMGIKIEED